MMWIPISVAVVAILVVVLLTRRGMRWGASTLECTAAMPGDAFYVDELPVRVALTRAISIAAPPDDVWPWLAQMGRGAGWYSYDRLDNGGKASAAHIVTWIPAPALGDAAAIGYVRHVLPPRELTWWVPGVGFLGARARLSVDIKLSVTEVGSRVVIRMMADAGGIMARPALAVFCVIDSIMAIRQLRGIRERAEQSAADVRKAAAQETGARDQYQAYEAIYASGESAGVAGKEHARRWREAAGADGVLR